jgi:hypothetical protein
MKKAVFLFLFIIVVLMGYSNINNNENLDAKDFSIIDISQQLLLAAKTKEPTDSLIGVVKLITPTQLQSQLINDDYKKVFWINLYNAFTQLVLSKNPDKYKSRNSFFGDKVIEIAGQRLSLDQIEHGLLRRSKVKWSLGHINKFFPSSFEKENRVSKVDYRIHFALNCGAKSCPPIAFYQPGQISKQLDLATKAYLNGDAEYDEAKNELSLPAIMGWFRGDFGGKKNMVALVKKLEIVPADKNPSVTFSKYDWNLFLENYKTE